MRGLSRKHGRAVRWDRFPPSFLEPSLNGPTCDTHTSGRWLKTHVLQERGHFPHTILMKSTRFSYASHCSPEENDPGDILSSSSGYASARWSRNSTGFGPEHTLTDIWASLFLNSIPWTSFSGSLISIQSRIKYLPLTPLTRIQWGNMCQVPGTE